LPKVHCHCYEPEPRGAYFTMDQAAQILMSFPSPSAGVSYKQLDSEYRNYVEQLASLPEPISGALVSQPDIALQIIDPEENSIGYLAVLHHLLHAAPSSPPINPVLLDAILNFILKFDALQVRHAGAWLLNLLECIADGKLFTPQVAVELLARAILKLDPSGSVMTSTHFLMVKLAYESNCTEPALQVIDRDIYNFPRTLPKDSRSLSDPELAPSLYISPSTGLTNKIKSPMVLEFGLLCALVYISRRDWLKAFDSLERVICHPIKDKHVSKIMVDAFKKWLLVGVLKFGRVPAIPTAVVPAAKGVFVPLAEPYTELVKLFKEKKTSELLAKAEAKRSTWAEDMNEGLVQELLIAYQQWWILEIRRVYRKVSVTKIRQETANALTGQPLPDNDAVLALLQGMLDSGMLRGQLRKGQAGAEDYLEFYDDASNSTDASFAKEIARAQASIEALGKEYRAISDRLSTNKDYAKHVLRQRRSDKEGHDASGAYDLAMEEEDLMTGITSQD